MTGSSTATTVSANTGARARARLGQRMGRLLLRVGADINVVGAERVPAHGPLIVASNHLSYVDALLKPSVMPRLDLNLLVWHEIERKPFFHFFANLIGRAIYLAPAPSAVFAMRRAVAVLRSGQVLLIAPEGQVSPTSTLQPARPGIGYLAATTGAPVLPTASTGQEALFANAQRFRRTAIRVEFGEPFLPPTAGLTQPALTATTDAIMRRIATMLPAQYRGVYSD